MGGGGSAQKQETINVQPSPYAASSKERRFFVGANWKCSIETLRAADALIDDLNVRWAAPEIARSLSDVELCVCPPYPFLHHVRQRLGSSMSVGAQNAWDSTSPVGQFTGAVTASMLAAVGCKWVMLGHSDRRNSLGETDDLIAAKVSASLAAGLFVNFTIGETRDVRDAGQEIPALLKQLEAAAAKVPAGAWGQVVVAYEPVWAVGEGAKGACDAAEAQRIHAALRTFVREEAGSAAALAVRLVYTGSVNASNAEEYAVLPDVDGFVVGRAGLDPEKLVDICAKLARRKLC